MVKNNEWVIPKNIERPIETVYELKGDEYKVPSFEEFMKDYQADEKVNYADLESSDIGSSKGYGPIGEYWVRYNTKEGQALGCGTYQRVISRFSLNIYCYNWTGDGGDRYADTTSYALECAHDLEDNNWPYSALISDEVLRKCATLVREAVRHYDRGNRVLGSVKVKGKFWGGYEWSSNY